MANQELLKYIKQQVDLGVSKDVVKTTLLGAGWPDADVNQAFDDAFPAAPAAAPAMAAAPVSVSPVTAGTNPFQEVKRPESAPSTISQDYFQPKSVDVFKPTAVASPALTAKPQFASPSGSVSATSGHPMKLIILASVLGLATIAFGFLYYQASGQNGSLVSQVNSLQSQVSSLNGRLSQSSQNPSPASDTGALQASMDDLGSQLAFFFATPGTAATGALQVNLRGTLSTSTAGYALTTSKGVVVALKNAKDPKFAVYLNQFVGSQVQIAGTHPALGSKDVTVLAVNGVDIKTIMAAAAATSTTSTSTAQPAQVAAPAKPNAAPAPATTSPVQQ